jgi:hypothetical protein
MCGTAASNEDGATDGQQQQGWNRDQQRQQPELSEAEKRQRFRDGIDDRPEVRAIAKTECEKRNITEYEVDPSKYQCCKHLFEPKYGKFCTGTQQGQPCWFSHHSSLAYESEYQTGDAAEMDRVWGEDAEAQMWVLAFAPSDSAVFRYVTAKTHRDALPTYKIMLEEFERLDSDSD